MSANSPSDTLKTNNTEPAADTQVAVSTGNTDNRVNFFAVLKPILESMNSSLSTQGIMEKALPKWVRIARIGPDNNTIADVIKKGARGGLITGMEHIIKLCLTLDDYLKYGSSATAVVEVLKDFVKSVGEDEVISSILKLQNEMKQNDRIANYQPEQAAIDSHPMKKINSVMQEAEIYMRFIPSPEDLDSIKKALYELVKINFSDYEQSGKLRLLDWSLNGTVWDQPTKGAKETVLFAPLGIVQKGESPDKECTFIDNAKFTYLPIKTDAESQNSPNDVLVFDFSKKNLRQNDAANTLLANYGYEALPEGITSFQKINGLTETGKLNPPTIARLLNMDLDNETLKKVVCEGEVQGEDSTGDE